jgi:hypothetical protein
MDDCTFDFAVTGAIPRSDAQINRAKRMAVGGGRKNCKRGKSCSATCIDSGEYCLVDLPWVTSNAMGKLKNRISTAKSAPDNRTQELRDRGFKTAGAKRIAQAERDAAAGKKVEIDKAPRIVDKEPGQKGRTSKQAERSAAIKAENPRRSISLDREEQAKAYRDMGMKTKDAVAQAKSDIPSEKSPAKKNRGSTSLAMSDVERIMRGEEPKHIRIASAANEEGFKIRSKEKSQMAQLQSVLKLGSLTRQEIGRDYSGLIAEAKNLKSNIQKDIKEAEKNGDSAKVSSLNKRLADVDKAIKGPNTAATGNTKWGREDARDADNRLAGEKLTRVGDKSYNKWEESYGPGSRKLGEGSYGTAMLAADGKTVVKRGDIATTEAGILDKVGKADLGPKLLAADIDGKPLGQMPGVEMKDGRIAMGVVPGKEMGRDADINTRYGPNKISAPDVYWKAMADLHRLGIAHNDAHIDNILVDDKGKGRWVDLGAAQANPKAALAEAMGIFSPLKGGDAISVPSGATGTGNWQTKQWDGTGVKQAERAKQAGGETWSKFKRDYPVASRVWDNRIFAIDNMKKMGLDVNDINSIIAHGIRSTPESYGKSDGFGRLTDAQAQKILNTLYEGI